MSFHVIWKNMDNETFTFSHIISNNNKEEKEEKILEITIDDKMTFKVLMYNVPK